MLSIGRSANVVIQAKEKWNDTGITVEAGQEYHFKAVGEWVDWFIRCDANGYTGDNLVLKLTEWLRRAPRENWFALIGAVNFDERKAFRIGAEGTMRMTTSGVLTCFANDVAFMYWNNSGWVELTVTRTR